MTPRIGVERERATGRRRRQPRRRPGANEPHELGEQLVEAADWSTARRAVPSIAACCSTSLFPQHDRERRARLQSAARSLRRLERDQRARTPSSCRRIVHVGEHEVLPHQNAELVAEIVEGVGLVDHRAADADHVHAGVAQLLERGAIVGGSAPRRARSSGVQQTPRQNTGDAIDDQAEAVRHRRRDRPRGSGSRRGRDRWFRRRRRRHDRQPHVVQRLRAMRVRPPAFGAAARGRSRRRATRPSGRRLAR